MHGKGLAVVLMLVGVAVVVSGGVSTKGRYQQQMFLIRLSKLTLSEKLEKPILVFVLQGVKMFKTIIKGLCVSWFI